MEVNYYFGYSSSYARLSIVAYTFMDQYNSNILF